MRPYSSSGRFWLDFNGRLKGFYGKVTFEPGGGVVLIVDRGKIGADDFLDKGLEIEVIAGELSEGAPCTILDCQCYDEHSFIGEDVISNVKIFGKCLLIGAKYDERRDVCFERIAIELSHMHEWFEPPFSLEYEEYRSNMSCLRYLPPEFTFTYSHDSVSFTVSLKTKASFPVVPSDEKVQYTYRHFFEISTDDRIQLDSFVQECSLLRSFFSFLLGHGVYTLRLSAGVGSHPKNDIEILWPVSIPSLIKINEAHVSTRFKDIAGEVSHAAKQWMHNDNKLYEVIASILEISSKESSSANSIFLRISQTLEHFYGVIWPERSKYVSKDEWRDKRAQIRDSLPGQFCLGSLDREQFLDRVAGLNNVSLRTKIADFVERMPQNQRNYIGPLCADLGCSGSVFSKRVADTRNYLTHYNKDLSEKAFQGQDLEIATRYLWGILNFWLAKYIGFSERTAGLIGLEASNSMFLVAPDRDL